MKKRGMLVAAAALGCLGVTGCVPTTPRWDSTFGETPRLMAAQQTLDPDAGSRTVSELMDGSASRESVVRYRSTFKEPPPPVNVFNIGVGGGGAR